MLEFRLKAYRHWLTLEMPTWAHLRIPEIDYQAISYYADPTKKKAGPKSMDEVDPELIKTFNKLGIPLEEQMAYTIFATRFLLSGQRERSFISCTTNSRLSALNTTILL